MEPDDNKAYREPVFNAYYDAYYQELASETLSQRWEGVDMVISFVVAVTASGSAIAGWTLWSMPVFKEFWIALAAVVSVVSIAHGVLRVPARVREQAELRQAFIELRIKLETLREKLLIEGMSNDVLSDKFDKLKQEFVDIMKRTHSDVLYTEGLRVNIQERLNKRLKERGYIE